VIIAPLDQSPGLVDLIAPEHVEFAWRRLSGWLTACATPARSSWPLCA